MPAASFGSISQLPANGDCGIKDVWNHNLHEEFQIIRQVLTFVYLLSKIKLIFILTNYNVQYRRAKKAVLAESY